MKVEHRRDDGCVPRARQRHDGGGHGESETDDDLRNEGGSRSVDKPVRDDKPTKSLA